MYYQYSLTKLIFLVAACQVHVCQESNVFMSCRLPPPAANQLSSHCCMWGERGAARSRCQIPLPPTGFFTSCKLLSIGSVTYRIVLNVKFYQRYLKCCPVSSAVPHTMQTALVYSEIVQKSYPTVSGSPLVIKADFMTRSKDNSGGERLDKIRQLCFYSVKSKPPALHSKTCMTQKRTLPTCTYTYGKPLQRNKVCQKGTVKCSHV